MDVENKRISGNKNEELEALSKKKCNNEKKSRSETATFTSEQAEHNVENLLIVGKGCNLFKSKTNETTYHLHECRSETLLGQLPDDPNLADIVPCEGYQPPFSSLSCTSFISAQSDLSSGQPLSIQALDSDDESEKRDVKLLLPSDNSNLGAEIDYLSVLKSMEKKMKIKDQKIKDLCLKMEESNAAKNKKISENKDLTHQVRVLNCQLQSMYELVKHKSWSKTMNPIEFLQYKNKCEELKTLIDMLDEDNKKLKGSITSMSLDLKDKEKELNAKTRELLDYKNRSTLEMCKLINKIDSLKRNLKNQAELCDNKIIEAQNFMDDELVRITTKLEAQYQEDLKSAIEKFHSNFERLASWPLSSIKKLLDMCDRSGIDIKTLKTDWEVEEKFSSSENKMLLSDDDKCEKKNNLENQITLLENHIKILNDELRENRKIIEVYENELSYEKDPAFMLLRSSDFSDIFLSLKELYNAEIIAQRKVHALELSSFEEKVKSLSEEIIYRARDEENHAQELENARKMAYIYREKYENSIYQWEEQIQKNFESIVRENSEKCILEGVFEQIKNLSNALKKAEEIHGEKMSKMLEFHNLEVDSYKKDIATFKNEISKMENFQNDQLILDGTIQELIENVSDNYIKTVEALVTSHVTELSLKQLELCNIEKNYMDEISSLESLCQKEVQILENKLRQAEESKSVLQAELDKARRECDGHKADSSTNLNIQELSLRILKYEGMMAVKEETENVLNERICELESSLLKKDENHKAELENLIGKLMEMKILSSAKDDLVKELEEKLNYFENLTKLKSEANDSSEGDNSEFAMLKKKYDDLNVACSSSLEKVRFLEAENAMLKRATHPMQNFIEKASNNISADYQKLKAQNVVMSETLAENEKIIANLKKEIEGILEKNEALVIENVEQTEARKRMQLQMEEEKKESNRREQNVSIEKNELLEKNKTLEEELKCAKEKMEELLLKIDADKTLDEERSYSISLKEVRVFYEQETSSDAEKSAAVEAVAYQKKLSRPELLRNKKFYESEVDVNNLLMENENLKMKLAEGKVLQDELSELVRERNEWIIFSKNLEDEKDRLMWEIDSLRNENSGNRTRSGGETKVFEEMACRTFKDERPRGENKINEMRWEVDRLSNSVKELSAKLNDMKSSSGEKSPRESGHPSSRSIDELTSQLEETWAVRRYDVEDELSKVRRENALLNLHRSQLEDTNRRISNLITESKPSVASWIKIHETVENIVDEVLALKTSFGSGGETRPETRPVSCSSSSGKTLQCDELLIKKRTLESEVRDLQELLKENDLRLLRQNSFSGWKKFSDFQNKHSSTYRSDVNPSFEIDEIRKSKGSSSSPHASGESHIGTLNLLKKHLESQVQAEEVEFRMHLEREIQDLKKEVQNLEKSIESKYNSLNGIESEEERQFILIEIRYEEEVLKLVKEYADEVKKLKSDFIQEERGSPYWEEVAREKYIVKIDKIKDYFGKQHADLGRKYRETYCALDKKLLNCALEKDRQRIIQCIKKILQTKEGKIQESELENFLNDTLNKYIDEIKFLKNKCKTSSIEHATETEILQRMIEKLKEGNGNDEGKLTLEALRNEYEEKLESQKKEFDLLIKRLQEKHKKELLECYSKMMMGDNGDANGGFTYPEGDIITRLEGKPLEIKSFSPYIEENIYFGGAEIKTDDDKLNIIRERDSLKEMVLSLRLTVVQLLGCITRSNRDSNDTTLKDFNDTVYKSVHINSGENEQNFSIDGNPVESGLDVSTVIQKIHDHSLLNSSYRVRFELDKCLNQIKEDAVGLLGISDAEGWRRLAGSVAQVEKEKNILQEKVKMIEENQSSLREEIEMTRDKLSHWERNLEVVSEGYGEEMIVPAKVVASKIFKGQQMVLSKEECDRAMTDETAVLDNADADEFKWKEEWKKEKFDLQQQIEVADKQLHSLRKFMEEQAAEREQEREAFDREINILKENLKLKDRNNSVQNRTNQEIDALESQVKDLKSQVELLESCKNSIECEFQNAVKKIWSLREVIQDLEAQLADSGVRESVLKKKLEKLDEIIKELTKVNGNLKEEMEMHKSENEIKFIEHIRNLEDEKQNLRRIIDNINPENIMHMKSTLRQIENTIIRKTKDLEQMHVSSANVSCSSPSEDVSIRDHFDATRCSTPDEMSAQLPQNNMLLPLEEIDRLNDKLTRHSRAEEVALKCIRDLKMQLKNSKKSREEIITERDALVERVDACVKENSNLKARLEEQRCNAALLQKKMNADLESQVRRLEEDWEKLSELSAQKDKQLNDMNTILENTRKALSLREAEALSKQKEENVLISMLKADLANALSEKELLESELEKSKEKFRGSLKIPALLDSVIDEKNAEIDRLEREVSKLSDEKSRLLMESVNLKANSTDSKSGKRIRFSEPESFEECLSTISPYLPSVMRHCGDSFDFKNSSFRIPQVLQHTRGVESLSSIGPLQLSPRGAGVRCNWKTSSPIGDALIASGNVTNSFSVLPVDKVPEAPKTSFDSHKSEPSETNKEVDDLKKRLTDLTVEYDSLKTQLEKLIREKELIEEEKIKLKDIEADLTAKIESSYRNYLEETDELKNKLNFERGKVEKVYDEIRVLERKKTEIEEAFFSLKQEYNEKSEREQNMIKMLVEKVRELESLYSESEQKLASVKGEMDVAVKEANETAQLLLKQLSDLKNENDALKITAAKTSTANAAIQVELESIENSLKDLIEIPQNELESKILNGDLNQMKTEFDKMAQILADRDFNRKDALLHLMAIKNFLSSIFENINEIVTGLETERKKLMEYSVDELALKVQRELVLSAKLDNELLSSIEAEKKGRGRKDSEGENSLKFVASSQETDSEDEVEKPCSLCQQMSCAIRDLERKKAELLIRVETQENLVKILDGNLFVEKERCKEDAKIMELLRLKLEKSLNDIKAKDKDLKRERHLREALEKEAKAKKSLENASESKGAEEFNRKLALQEEKLRLLNEALDKEKLKNKDLRLNLERHALKKVSETEARKLWECDYALLKEQKENIQSELIKLKELLQSRDREINLLKRKINLQEIDIKALNLSGDVDERASSILARPYSSPVDFFSFLFQEGLSKSLLVKMKKLNDCVERHIHDNYEAGDAFPSLERETNRLADRVKKPEESGDGKSEDETLLADVELERKLWDLEKGKLLTDVEALKNEYEMVKRNSVDAIKKNEHLQVENSKLKAEIMLLEREATNHMEVKSMRERVGHLLGKYLRSESYRKALVWQKHFLTITLNSYRSSEEGVWKKAGKVRGRKREEKSRGTPGMFRVVSLAVVAIFRMKYIVRRWQKHKASFSRSQLRLNSRQNLPETVSREVDIEPLNPMSYHCENLFRQSPSRVLSSPPSRDPGLENGSERGGSSSGGDPPGRVLGRASFAAAPPPLFP